MKRLLLVLLLLPVFAKGQIYPGPHLDSAKFTFSTVDDSLIRHIHSYLASGDTAKAFIDTSGATLWQIGNTLKPVFATDTVAMRGIMTDTLHPYPANANDYFTLKMEWLPNCIISIWHKYETDSLHAGGMVEFSTDSGATWINVANCFMVYTDNFYTQTDTIISGQAAFTGNSHGEQLSSFVFENCIGARTTSGAVCSYGDVFVYNHPIYFRFRFVSDTTVDTLSGWMIDSIKIVTTQCEGGVKKNIAAKDEVSIFPNPATSSLTIQSGSEPIDEVIITNLLGQVVYSSHGSTRLTMTTMDIDVSNFPNGVYFVRVNNVVRKLLKE